jgi:hypothetical protein
MILRKLIDKGALATALLLLAACSTPPSTSSILLGGDVMLYRGGKAIFQTSPWGEVKEIFSSEAVDIFAVNLESPFGEVNQVPFTENPDMNLCADMDAVNILLQGGIDLVTTANNHSSDCPAEAIHPAQALESAGIQSLGRDDEPLLIPAGEQSVAFIAVDDSTGTFDHDALMEKIRSARESSDLVVVSIHWGNEYQAGPGEEQEELAQELVNAGVDVVWGHHPHVLQRMEWRESEVDGHRALVMYSLGNLLTDQRILPDTFREALVRIEFSNHVVTAVTIYPLLMKPTAKELEWVRDTEIVNLITTRLNLDLLNVGEGIVKTWKE